MKKIGALLLVLLLAGFYFVPGKTGADLGNFSGDTDYGSSDWGSSSDWDSDWSGSGSSDDLFFFAGLMSGSSSDSGSLLAIAIFVVLVAAIIMKARQKSASGAQRPAGAERTASSELQPMSSYTAEDKNFSEQRLREKLSNLYVQMQNCCTDRDIEPLRPYFTDALYQQYNRQIQGLKQRGETNYVERISVLGVQLRGWCRKGDTDHIIAELRTRITDYTLKDADGSLVSGSRTAEKFMTYEYDLSRPAGTETMAEGAAINRHCPNCGAPLSINESAKCPYCDSVITLKAQDWVIAAIKGIRQETR